MFGADMLGKMGAMKKMAEESKEKLNQIFIEGEAGGNLVLVTLNGNREIQSIKINTDHKMMDLEDLEDLLTVAFKRAMEKANVINEQEVMMSAKSMFPGM